MITADIGPAISTATSFQTNPFVMLTFISAPALLTNACALLAMSTSNRLARAVDRAREIARQIEGGNQISESKLERLVNEFTVAETRGILLMKALRCFYLSLSCFSIVALVSLVGSAITVLMTKIAEKIFFLAILITGLIGVAVLVYGAILLLRETKMVVAIMHNRIVEIRKNLRSK